MKMLLVEDDRTLRITLRDHFITAGWQVVTAQDGESGLSSAFEKKIDLILLDVMLPGLDGYEICKSLRREKVETPILMLTAKGQVDDVVMGLELGADDYLVKPFSLRVLDARVKGLMRRVDQGVTEFRFGDDFFLDLTARKFTQKNREIDLTPKEFDLLLFFLQRAGRAQTREQLLGAVWGHGLMVTSRSVDRCVKTLRRKLGPSSGLLVSVRGVGYRWDGD